MSSREITYKSKPSTLSQNVLLSTGSDPLSMCTELVAVAMQVIGCSRKGGGTCTIFAGPHPPGQNRLSDPSLP